mmetsp:Transcript_53157/g.104063  ORF Transcript_53157/g.104063 Transcript_53157/m.104063 type:complete len:122 (-) Transcript_53157:419-784(-)
MPSPLLPVDAFAWLEEVPPLEPQPEEIPTAMRTLVSAWGGLRKPCVDPLGYFGLGQCTQEEAEEGFVDEIAHRVRQREIPRAKPFLPPRNDKGNICCCLCRRQFAGEGIFFYHMEQKHGVC